MSRKKRRTENPTKFVFLLALIVGAMEERPCGRCGCKHRHHRPPKFYTRHLWRIGQGNEKIKVIALTSCDCPYCVCFCHEFIEPQIDQRWKMCVYNPLNPVKPEYEKTSFRLCCEYCEQNPCICHVLSGVFTALLSKVLKPPVGIIGITTECDPPTKEDPNVDHGGKTTTEIIAPTKHPEENSQGDPSIGAQPERINDTSWFTAPRPPERRKGTGKPRKGPR